MTEEVRCRRFAVAEKKHHAELREFPFIVRPTHHGYSAFSLREHHPITLISPAMIFVTLVPPLCP
jgi:hypothetical protein